jgi:hypothetical protein
VSDVGLATTTLLAVTPVPLTARFVEPATKFVPVKATVIVDPAVPVDGITDPSVGALEDAPDVFLSAQPVASSAIASIVEQTAHHPIQDFPFPCAVVRVAPTGATCLIGPTRVLGSSGSSRVWARTRQHTPPRDRGCFLPVSTVGWADNRGVTEWRGVVTNRAIRKWSGRRGSNPCNQLGKLTHYHCVTPATCCPSKLHDLWRLWKSRFAVCVSRRSGADQRQHLVAFLCHLLRRRGLEVQPEQRLGV